MQIVSFQYNFERKQENCTDIFKNPTNILETEVFSDGRQL